MPRKDRKKLAQNKDVDEEDDGQLSQASGNMEADANMDTDSELNHDVHLGIILKELREFRRDSNQQLNGIKEDINKMNKRVEEAEERIDEAETRIQSTEDVLSQLVKLQVQMEAKLTDLEGRSRRDNIRLHGVKEGAEDNVATMISFVEDLLMKGLELPPTTELHVERAHRSLAPKPPTEAPPRSIVIKFASYRTKEDMLKRAWQVKGFDFQGRRVHLDHDYAPELLKKRREYKEAKAVLKERNIRFQTPFPARMRVFYTEGTVTYSSAEVATADMAERGLPVTVLKSQTSLLDRVNQLTWRHGGRRGNREDASCTQSVKDRLRGFRAGTSDK